ncbi:fructose-bisphosphatase class III, partial [Streptococcus thermophilus]|nr:fructose-bisphosphatase class III [Streptococcus thermophilus]
DILWIGGAAGSALCIANLVRISARYNNLSILEDVYGINLRHLARLAEQYYQDNLAFSPKMERSDRPITEAERLQIT